MCTLLCACPRTGVCVCTGCIRELLQAQQHHSLEIRCKPEYHRFLIGRGGANIRKVIHHLYVEVYERGTVYIGNLMP